MEWLGVDVGVSEDVFADGILGDVVALGFVVGEVADAVLMVAGVPDLAGRLLADGVGVAAFDELEASGGGLIDRGGDEEVDVVGHEDEGVEKEAALVSVAEEGGEEEVRVRGALEVAVALVNEDGDGVGGGLLAVGGHGAEDIVGGG